MTERVRRARRVALTDAKIAELPRRGATYFFPDPLTPGFGIRVRPKSSRAANSFVVVCRDPWKRQKWVTLERSTDAMTLAEAQEEARAIIKRVKAGLPALEPPPVEPDTVSDVIDQWLKRHVDKEGLRTASEIKRLIEAHIRPVWGKRVFAQIGRRAITDLLDAIEDQHSAFVADAVLVILRSAANWQAKRDDTYTPPFVKGMRRVSKARRERSRILGDDELRAIWRAAEADGGTPGALVRILLLTSARLAKVAAMRWVDLSADGVWTIPTAPREKGNPGTLKLPEAAMAIINIQPRFASSPYVFAGTRYGHPFNSFGIAKKVIDEASGVRDWKLHDCRRTAKTLMARAGVRPDISERVLGHAIGGVEGVYDRHGYDAEKAEALAKLAALIERIVNPPADNVVAFQVQS